MTNLELKEMRQKLGLTQVQLAELIGVDAKTIQNWEYGRKIPNTKYGILREVLSGNIPLRKIHGGQHVRDGDAVNGDKIVEKVTEREIEIDKAEIECNPLVMALQSNIASLESTIADQRQRILFLESQLADANKRIQVLTDKLLDM